MKKMSIFIFALLLISLLPHSHICARVMADPAQQDNQEIEKQNSHLKPAAPKWDQSKENYLETKPSEQKAPLRGSVQHSEVLKPGQQAGIQDNQSDGNMQQGKIDTRKGLFRGRLGRQTKESAEPEVGLGIIGVKFVLTYGRPPIIDEVFPGTPADTVGLRPRDVIIAVDGRPTFGLSKDDVYNMIVGQPDTAVTLSVRRGSDFQVHKMIRMDLNKIADPYLKRDYFKM